MEIDQQSMKIAQIFIMEDLAKTFNLSLISHEIDSIDTMEQKSNIHFTVKEILKFSHRYYVGHIKVNS